MRRERLWGRHDRFVVVGFVALVLERVADRPGGARNLTRVSRVMIVALSLLPTPIWGNTWVTGLVGVAAKSDRQLAGASVNGDALFDVDQYVSELVSEVSVTDAEVVCEAEGPRPLRHRVECFATQHIAVGAPELSIRA